MYFVLAGFPKDPNSIDLSQVRLCFQVFLPDDKGKFTNILTPAVSQPIYDKSMLYFSKLLLDLKDIYNAGVADPL